MKEKVSISAALLIIMLFLSSCDGFKFPKMIFETSARAKYERSFSGSTDVLAHWKKLYDSALSSDLVLTESNAFTFKKDSATQNAIGYLVEAKQGEMIVVEAKVPEISSKIFVDVIWVNNSSNNANSKILENGVLKFAVPESGWHRIIIQPEISVEKDFPVKIYSTASLKFPVAGKSNKDVQSFWGASRDGGARNHEGIDIFARKGTPVLAASDGFVIRTGHQGLGGKQVWMRDGIFGNSLYYAHLDSILVESGRQVSAGDPLGLVGNTGNAAGGAPHLHFGIYTVSGAVDPYPFIKIKTVPEDHFPTKQNYSEIKAGSKIYKNPQLKGEAIHTVSTHQSILVKAEFKNILHIKLLDGAEGFAAKRDLK